MHKAPHTVSPIRQSLWGSACLSACVSPLSVIITSQLQEGEKKMCALLCTDDDDVYELLHARINQSFLCMLHPSCQQMDTSGTTLGVSLLKLPPLPPPTPLHLVLPLCLPHPSLLFPSPLWAHRAERKASILHRQAPEPGCRQWKPFSVTVKRQI